MNSVNLLGRLTKEPELIYSSNGMAIVSATIAVNRAFKTQDGVEADFIRIKAFKKTAELIAKLKKGEQLGVTGTWQTGSFDNQKGERVYTNDCIVNQLTFVSNQGGQTNSNQQSKSDYSNYQKKEDPFEKSSQPVDINEDDLPF